MTRNIGLPVTAPKKKPDDNDKKNPFNGTLAIRGKLFEGTVISAGAKNTVVVEKDSPVYFTKFKRYARGKSRIHAHVPSNIEVKEGALTEVHETNVLEEEEEDTQEKIVKCGSKRFYQWSNISE